MKKKDKQKKEETYKNLRIERPVTLRFREFSTRLEKSPSETLSLLLNSFVQKKPSQKQKLESQMKSLEQSLEKKIDSLIAILCNIEKKQTKPTHAMLAALFGEISLDGKKPKPVPDIDSLLFSPTANVEISESSTAPVNPDLLLLLENLEYHKSGFSKGYCKLHLDRNELEQLKQKYHVHRH